MAAMQNVLNLQSSTLRTIPQPGIADFSESSLSAENGGFANFPIVLQLPEGDCPKYCLNIKVNNKCHFYFYFLFFVVKVEVTRLGRNLMKTCRNTPLCSSKRK